MYKRFQVYKSDLEEALNDLKGNGMPDDGIVELHITDDHSLQVNEIYCYPIVNQEERHMGMIIYIISIEK